MNVSDDVIALHSQICDVENFLGRIDGSIDRAVPVNKYYRVRIMFWSRFDVVNVARFARELF